jgi:hypothetical protein
MRRRRHRYTLLAIAAALLAAAPLTAASASTTPTVPAGAIPQIIGAGHTFIIEDGDGGAGAWQYDDAVGIVFDGSPEGSSFKAGANLGDNYQTLTDTADSVCLSYFNSGTIMGVKYTDVLTEHNCTAGGETPTYVEWQFVRLPDGYWVVGNLWSAQETPLCAGGYAKVVTEDNDGFLQMQCPADGTGVDDPATQEWNVVPA